MRHLKSTHVQLQLNHVDRLVERPGKLVLPQGFQDDVLHELQLVGLPALLVWVRHLRGRGIPEPRRVRLGVCRHDGGRLWAQPTSRQMYTGRFLLPVQQLIRGRSNTTSLHSLSGKWIVVTVNTQEDQQLFFIVDQPMCYFSSVRFNYYWNIRLPTSGTPHLNHT